MKKAIKLILTSGILLIVCGLVLGILSGIEWLLLRYVGGFAPPVFSISMIIAGCVYLAYRMVWKRNEAEKKDE